MDCARPMTVDDWKVFVAPAHVVVLTPVSTTTVSCLPFDVASVVSVQVIAELVVTNRLNTPAAVAFDDLITALLDHVPEAESDIVNVAAATPEPAYTMPAIATRSEPLGGVKLAVNSVVVALAVTETVAGLDACCAIT